MRHALIRPAFLGVATGVAVPALAQPNRFQAVTSPFGSSPTFS